MDHDAKAPEEDGAAETGGFVQASRRAGRFIVEGAGTGIAATARGARALGRGVGSVAARGWSGITTGRAQRAEARIEAAREAARFRGMELAGKDTQKRIDAVSESEGEVEVGTPEEPEPEPEPEPELEPEPEPEPDPEPEPRVEEEISLAVSGGNRVRVLAGGMAGMLGTAARGTGRALGKAGKVVGPTGTAIKRGGVAGGRKAGAGLARVGKALGSTGAAIGRGFVAASRGVGRVLGSMGRVLASVGAVAFAGVNRGLRWMGDAVGRWIHRIRKAWAARQPRPRLWTSVGAVVVVIVSYVLAQVSVASRVASDTTMLGVDVGGVSVGEARDLLEEQLIEVSSSVVSLSAHGRVVVLDPEELGLSIDVEATLGSLAGFSWSPSALWSQVVGAGPIEPVVMVDEAAFTQATNEAATILRQEARDAEVTLGPTGALVLASQDGVDIEADDIARMVLEAWPSDSPIAVPIEVTPPVRDTGEAQRFARAVNGIVLDSPVILSSPNGSVILNPEDVIAHGSILPDGPGFSLAMDEDTLGALILERFPQIENAAVDARLAFDSKHQLVVKPGVPARALDIEALDEVVTNTVMSASRAGEVPLLESPPAVTTEELEASDFQELVSTYHTSFVPRGYSREVNIINAAAKLAGVVVEPGEVFSITDAIGPINSWNGYVVAGVIVGGEHVDGMGGGLCQIATTSYAAIYLAGYEIVERRPHTEWFSRYPAGRDAAIAPGIDMRFKNDTPYAMMFNAYIEDTGLRVDIWSIPYYTVEASVSGKYNITGGGYRTETETPCYPSYPKNGFTITDTRNIYLDGEFLKSEKRVSVYRAVSGTRCE